MSKKSKKYETNGEQQASESAAPVVNTKAAEAKPSKPKAPGLYVQDEDGAQFKFIRYPLPKRAGKEDEAKSGDFKITVDDQEVEVWKTSNVGTATEGTALTYCYFRLNGTPGYVVLQGEDIAGMLFTSGEGDANRANPKADSKMTEEQLAEKLAKAKATREANLAKKASEASEPATEAA